jgi:DNA-binding GntR family transcriptional regulator
MAARQTPVTGAPTIRKRKPPVYERIKEAIASGEIGPGTPLVETALAEWCQVSRTPVREALTRLEQDGVVARSERGLIVRARSHEEILDIYETRIVLEGTVSRVAAVRRSSVDVIYLRHADDAMRRIDVGNEMEMVSANREFHRAVWHASHNESLIELLMRLDLHVARYPATTLSYPGRWQEANCEHHQILKAIEAQDDAYAEELTRQHFTKARNLRLTILATGR